MKLPIGIVIKELREERGMTQRQVADQLLVPRTYVSKIENGRSLPQLDNFIMFAAALDVEPWTILRKACQMRDGVAA